MLFISFFLSYISCSLQSPLITDNLLIIAGQLRQKFNSNTNLTYSFSIDEIRMNITNCISIFTADPTTYMDFNNGILQFSDVNSTVFFDIMLNHTSPNNFTVYLKRRGIVYLNFNSISFIQSIENSLSLKELSPMSLHLIIDDLKDYDIYEKVLDDENKMLKELFSIKDYQ